MARTSVSPLFQHVVCPVDFSDASQLALRHGAEIARRSGGRLTAVFVRDPLLASAAAAAGYSARKLAAETDAELRRFLEAVFGTNAPPIVVADGEPAPEILRTAARQDGDLIVMGSRGLSGAGKWVVGSTAARVLRKTRVPVLVVHGDVTSESPASPDLESWPGERVLVPIDLADYRLFDVARAIRAADFFRAKPVLMHAVPAPRLPPWLQLEDASEHRAVARADAALRKIALRVGGGANCHVTMGDAAEQIAVSARTLGMRLIILTIKRSSTVFGPRQGTIAYRVLCDRAAPILAIPEARA